MKQLLLPTVQEGHQRREAEIERGTSRRLQSRPQAVPLVHVSDKSSETRDAMQRAILAVEDARAELAAKTAQLQDLITAVAGNRG